MDNGNRDTETYKKTKYITMVSDWILGISAIAIGILSDSILLKVSGTIFVFINTADIIEHILNYLKTTKDKKDTSK